MKPPTPSCRAPSPRQIEVYAAASPGGPGRGKKGVAPSDSFSPVKATALAAAGISRQEASEAEALARIPEEAFEAEMLEELDELLVEHLETSQAASCPVIDLAAHRAARASRQS